MHLPDYKEARTRDKRSYNRCNFKIDDKIDAKYKGKKYFVRIRAYTLTDDYDVHISKWSATKPFKIK